MLFNLGHVKVLSLTQICICHTWWHNLENKHFSCVNYGESKLGIVRFALCDFKFFSVQALLTSGWHFTSSTIHAFTLFFCNSPYYSYTWSIMLNSTLSYKLKMWHELLTCMLQKSLLIMYWSLQAIGISKCYSCKVPRLNERQLFMGSIDNHFLEISFSIFFFFPF
jgi:hypothetical protein